MNNNNPQKYKNTEIGSIPQDWEVKKLGELSSLITKGTTPRRFSKTGINYIKIESLDGAKINTEKCLFIDELTHKIELKRSILNDGDLLFAIAGATIGKCTFVTKDIIPANTNQALAIIRLKENENRAYVFYFLKSTLMQKYVVDNIAGGAQPNMNLAQMGQFSFPLPPTLTEQTAIATALSDADTLINSLEKLIEKKRNIKQGAMQKLLQPQEGWEVKKLGEIAEIKSGKRLPLGKQLTERTTQYPYIRILDMFDGGISLKDIKYVPEDVFPYIRNYRIFKEDIYISVAGTLGLVGRIPDILNGANLTENANKLTNIKCNIDYLLFVLKSDFIQNKIEAEKTLGAQPKLALLRIRNFEIPFPPLETQIEIATILSDMDLELGALSGKLAKLRAMKLGMMQELLTGRIRLI